MQAEARNKIFIFLLAVIFLFTFNLKVKSDAENSLEFECLTETGVSGLFQNQKKFLKDTQFFPYKTIMSFNNDYQDLTEKDNTLKKEIEAKYKFKCHQEVNKKLLHCSPTGKIVSYDIKFSLETLRYRKSLISDYWIMGKGNEVDYVHIAHGYCYRINN